MSGGSLYQSRSSREIYKREFTRAIGSCIVGAEKLHDRLSESWRPQDADSLAQFKFKGLRTREASDVTLSMDEGLRTQRVADLSPGVQRPEILELDVLWQEVKGVPAPGKREENHLASASLVLSGSQLTGWCPPTVRADFPHSVHGLK